MTIPWSEAKIDQTDLGDGLRHFAYQKEQKFYNGVSLEDIYGSTKKNVNGIQGKRPACNSHFHLLT